MRLLLPFLLVPSLLAAPAAHTQHAHDRHRHASPYAGFESRAIKALSPAEIADLRAGRGMGLALAAELNGYPGPMHALELAGALGLDADQAARMRDLEAGMRREAIALGERLVAQEADLDRLFAERRITPGLLHERLAAIGATQAALREAHLRTHLAAVEILRPGQVKAYAGLRGYGRP